jgi:hypothetical protein
MSNSLEIDCNSPTGVTLEVVAEQVASGVLSLKITPSRPTEVSAVGFCLPALVGEKFYGLGERFGSFNLAGHVRKTGQQTRPG